MKSTEEQDRRAEPRLWRGKQDVEVTAETEPPGSAAALCPGESDDAIIERIRNGDINAFELLMRRYERWVLSIVAKHAPHHQATELVHEVFLQAYKSLPHYSPRRSLAAGGQSPGRANPSADGFRQWLAAIAVRRCYDYHRAANRHPTCAVSNLSAEDADQMEQTDQAAAGVVFHEDMELDATREALREAMDRLDADDRILLGLLYWQGHSLPETAAILGCSPGNVRIRAGRACARLHQQMDASSRTEERLAPEAALIPA